MAKDAQGDKRPAAGAAARPDPAPPARHVYGPRPLAALLPPIVRPAFKARSPAAAQLMSDWAALAGPELAAMATPRRLSGGTLTLAANGPAALELQHLEPQLIARLNGALGRPAVERLRFTQDDRAAPAAPAAPGPPPGPISVALPEGELHDALARLGGWIAARTP